MQISQENQPCEISAHITVRNKGQSTFKWHKNCEIAFLFDKPCRFWIAGEVIRAKKGDIVFFNTHTVHSFIQEEDATSIGLLIFDVKAVLNPGVKFTPLKRHITAGEIDAVGGLREKIDALFSYATIERSALKVESNPVMQSLVAAIYLLLMRHFPEEATAPVKKQLADFYKMVDYINDHFRENINVKILAQNLYMSREKVSAVFLKYANMRLNDYLDKLRIDYVNKLILEGSNITDAAFESGFQSIRTFNSTYKKVTGVSPSEYIKVNINNRE